MRFHIYLFAIDHLKMTSDKDGFRELILAYYAKALYNAFLKHRAPESIKRIGALFGVPALVGAYLHLLIQII